MKNENSKGKAFLLLSMIAFFIMSATFLVMPLIQTNIDSGSNAYNIIIGIIFWLTLIFGMISLLYICYIFFSAVTFTFIMHCILNGKMFNCLIINKKRSEA